MRDLFLKSIRALMILCFAAFAGNAFAQCPAGDATLPTHPLDYPMTSDRYAVQYRVDGGPWTNVRVYISYYGETDGSAFRTNSGYTLGATSMSFVSIPARANSIVQLRVTKLFDGPFQRGDRVSVRPSVKLMDVDTRGDGTVQISTVTSSNFAGEQFVLWWNHGADGGAVESLAFFLNPPYTSPVGSNVKVVTTPADLTGDLSLYDTLDFEGTVDISSSGTQAFLVPRNILSVFLGQDAWVKGKFRFDLADTNSNGVRKTRTLYGPGVLDVSLFNYENRNCVGTADEYYALSSSTTGDLNQYHVDGIVITDHNHAANDIFFNSTVNNMKTLGWNSENAALRIGDHTTVSNVFIRSGDDSLMVWGSPVSVTNATVWQNFNGAVANLGWSFNSVGDNNSIDGLYVIKTDWLIPKTTSFTARQPSDSPLQGQNNAVFASLMVPTTMYGTSQPPVYRNIFVEDPPQVLFSLKILPPICAPNGLVCPSVDLTQGSVLNLNIENLFSPLSILPNSIGFQNVPDNYAGDGQPGFTLTGTMKIGFTNVFVKLPDGILAPLLGFDAAPIGKITTNGNVNVTYDLGLSK